MVRNALAIGVLMLACLISTAPTYADVGILEPAPTIDVLAPADFDLVAIAAPADPVLNDFHFANGQMLASLPGSGDDGEDQPIAAACPLRVTADPLRIDDVGWCSV